jgi:hypothetical protein
MESADVIEEIRLVPKNRLRDIYNFIHFFRIGLEKSQEPTEDMMQFAGCWQDMTDEEFEHFSQEITERR